MNTEMPSGSMNFKELELTADEVIKEDVAAPRQPRRYRVRFNPARFTFFKVTGLRLSTPNPFTVLAQVRAPDNNNPRYSDSFVLTVNETSNDFIRFKIWRVDSPADPGADIQLDFAVWE